MREDASDISYSEASEGDPQGDSHFQIDVDGFQFAQVEKEFEPQIANLFKQAWRNTKAVRNDVKPRRRGDPSGGSRRGHPRVDDAAIPGVDDVELPGVDGDVHTPDNVEISDLDTTTDAPIFEAEAEELEAAPVEPAEQQAAPVEPAPVAQPAETNEARTPTQTAPQ